MKLKLIISVIIALVAGFLLGKFLPGNKATTVQTEQLEEVSEEKQEEIWTCSMHPQIRQNEPGACPICGMDLIPLDALSSGSGGLYLEMTESAVRLANIQTSVIGSAGGEGGTIRLNGRIKADETRSASIVTHIPGRIEKLYVSFTGDRVSAGQRIATMYSPELISAQRELLEAAKMAETSPSLLEASKNKLRLLKVSNAVIDEILESKQIRETFDIFSGHSGVVMQRRVAVGDYLKTGDVLYDVLDLSALWVLFDVYESDLANVKLGSRVSFTTPSLPGVTFKGSIAFIDPLIDPETRVATVRVEINNSGGKLKPDMFVSGTMTASSQNKEGLRVPKTAVLWTGKRSVVYVKVPGTTVPSYEFREVVLGDAAANDYAVAEGLTAGEEVVTHGAFVIDAAAQLNNRSSMMNRNVSVKGNGQPMGNPDYTASTPEAFKRQMTELVEQYLKVKDALVRSDPAEAGKSTAALLTQLDKLDMSLLDGESHTHWMMRASGIKTHIEDIAAAADLRTQRDQFELLSVELIAAVKSFGIYGDTLYVQHCPMVNDNNGADWISRDKLVRNPYFGDKMLTCGVNTDTITFKKALEVEFEPSTSSVHDH